MLSGTSSESMTPRTKRRYGRQKLRILGDEHAPHVELDAALALGVEQVERRARRHEQQHGIGLAPLGPVVERQRRFVELVRDSVL